MVKELNYKISDEEIYQGIYEHIKFLNEELGGLHKRVQSSLGRMDEMERNKLITKD